MDDRTGSPDHGLRVPVLARMPWSFAVSRWLMRNGVRGSSRLFRLLRERGALDACVDVPLGNGVLCTVPLYREPEWDAHDVAAYERAVVARLVDFVRRAPKPVTLVDCGADIGLVSLKVAAEVTPARIVAFEPSRDAHPLLARNLARLGPAHLALRAGVGDRPGQGVLHAAPHDPDSAHARFVEPVAHGDFPLTTVDALELPPGGGIALKIDVEGGEAAVVRGARRTLRDAAAFAVTYEAHPEQVRRSGVDPTEIAGALAEIRPVRIAVIEAPDRTVRLDRPLFDQLPPDRVYNLLVDSRPPH